MPSFETIAAVIAIYIAITVLLLSLNIFSRWRWWVKAGAIALCGVFFAVSYFGINSLLGLPSREQVPDRFNLLATRVVEPDKRLGDPGSIYLWLELIDDDNIPSGKPLSYQISYTDGLARAVDKAQQLIDQGSDVEAILREVTEEEEENSEAGTNVAADSQSPSGSGMGEHVRGVNLVFNNMPPVKLPGKGPL